MRLKRISISVILQSILQVMILYYTHVFKFPVTQLKIVYKLGLELEIGNKKSYKKNKVFITLFDYVIVMEFVDLFPSYAFLKGLLS